MTMIASEFDGRAVLYVDLMKLQHSGVIVVQSPDKSWLFVQSDNPKVPPRQWHFKVARETLPGILQ